MNTLKKYESQIINDWKKLVRVISSCENKEQLINAHKYYMLWVSKYSKLSKINPNVSYIDGFNHGLLKGMLQKYL